jgi:hypothetical protein
VEHAVVRLVEPLVHVTVPAELVMAAHAWDIWLPVPPR